jgi:hypothetical protein
MEPVSEWRVLDYDPATTLSIAQVANLIASSRRNYIAVVENEVDSNARRVRGLFSDSRLKLLLGAAHPGSFENQDVARTLPSAA